MKKMLFLAVALCTITAANTHCASEEKTRMDGTTLMKMIVKERVNAIMGKKNTPFSITLIWSMQGNTCTEEGCVIDYENTQITTHIKNNNFVYVPRKQQLDVIIVGTTDLNIGRLIKEYARKLPE